MVYSQLIPWVQSLVKALCAKVVSYFLSSSCSYVARNVIPYLRYETKEGHGHLLIRYNLIATHSCLILVVLYHGNSIAYPGSSIAVSFYLLDAGQSTISTGVMLCIKWTTLGLEPPQLNRLPTGTLELGYNRSAGV